jgi:hypothetical protein
MLGVAAGSSTTIGNRNIFIGPSAGNGVTTGGFNTFVGADTSSTLNSVTGSIVLGSNAFATANNQFVVGSVVYNAGSVTSEVNTSTQVWNVVINGVARKILLA